MVWPLAVTASGTPVFHPTDEDLSAGTPVARPKGDDPGKGDELWLPTGAEATVAARVLLVKGMRQNFIERDLDYKRFQVEAVQGKTARVVTP